MTNQDRDALDDVTKQMDVLEISPSLLKGEEGLYIDSDVTQPKRTRQDGENVSKLLKERISLFDPLLYLRTKSAQLRPEVMFPPQATAERPSVPTFDEIMKGPSTSLLVEPISRTVKPARPLDQERKEPPKPNGPKLPVAVYRFCQKHNVSYQTLKVSRTFRSIVFSRTRSKTDGSDPWEDYIDLNSLQKTQLCHALYFRFSVEGQSDEGRVVALVPHTSKSQGETDIEKIKSAIGAKSVDRISLTHMEKELGFPTFVCPPFGHEFAPNLHKNASSSLSFTTVIDSSLLSQTSRPCVFDLGMVLIRVLPAELVRVSGSLNWISIDNLVKRHFQ